MRRLLTIPALLALICTLTPYSTDAQGITDILSLIARGDTASMSDSVVKRNAGSVLSFIINAETDDSDADIEAWDIARALDACGEAWNDSSYLLTGGALGFISKAYSTNDFYKSGAWEPQQFETIESSGIAPQAVLEFTGGILRNAPRFGRLTSGFGFRPRFGRMHKGLDFAMAIGDTVHVPLSGKVTHVGTGRGYGTYVIISHGGGLETRYAHLQASLVQPGDIVNLGDAIALSGNTGNSTGPHLHFETRFYGTAVDPRQVFTFSGF